LSLNSKKKENIKKFGEDKKINERALTIKIKNNIRDITSYKKYPMQKFLFFHSLLHLIARNIHTKFGVD